MNERECSRMFMNLPMSSFDAIVNVYGISDIFLTYCTREVKRSPIKCHKCDANGGWGELLSRKGSPAKHFFFQRSKEELVLKKLKGLNPSKATAFDNVTISQGCC